MKVLMLKTVKGSPNGYTVNTYKSGNEYEIEGSLLKVFLSLSHCKQFDVEVAPVTKETLVEENKAVQPKESKAEPKKRSRKKK